MNDLSEEDQEALDIVVTTAAHVAACALGQLKYVDMSYEDTVDHLKPLMESALIRASVEYGDNNE